MATFVLVHGAWHGGWCWKRVTPLLRAAGHAVLTPTLTGLGERSHLLAPSVDLQTHVTDVVNVLHCEDLRDVVLVGHSYGGMVITGVADRAADRLAHLVYLDAFVPGDGESVLDQMSEAVAAAFRSMSETTGEGWRIPPRSLERFGVTAAADLAWAGARLGDQPIRTFDQPLRYDVATVAVLPRTYILCTEFTGGTFTPVAQRLQADPSWHYRELATGHDAMITAPDDLAALLLQTVSPAHHGD